MSPRPRRWRRLQQPCMYRVHDAPDPEKLEALREFLDEPRHLSLRCQGPGRRARSISTASCRRAEGRPERGMVNELVLRTPGPGGLQPRQYRPFRPGAAALRPFHLADPPLRRSARASRADRGPAAGRRRPGAGRSARRSPSWASQLRARAPRRHGGARRGRPLSSPPTWPTGSAPVRRPDHRRHPLRPVRDPGRERRRRAGPDPHPARRLLRP